MAEIVVPFTIDEDEVNTLDTVPVSLGTVSGASSLVRVPTRIELRRKAGTAYAVTRLSQSGDVANTKYEEFFPVLTERTWDVPALVVREVNDAGYPVRRIFSIPIDFLTETSATGVVAFPVGGLTFDQGDITLEIASGVGLSGGTGDLEGRVYFDEYPT